MIVPIGPRGSMSIIEENKRANANEFDASVARAFGSSDGAFGSSDGAIEFAAIKFVMDTEI